MAEVRSRAVRTARLHPAPRPAARTVRVAELDGLGDAAGAVQLPLTPGPAPRRRRPLREDQFGKQVTDLAETLGWGWIHLRPARTKKGWRTPVSGPLGKGWPDYQLVRGPRLIFAELKTQRGEFTDEQPAVLDALRGLVVPGDRRIEVHVWRPSDLEGAVADALR